MDGGLIVGPLSRAAYILTIHLAGAYTELACVVSLERRGCPTLASKVGQEFSRDILGGKGFAGGLVPQDGSEPRATDVALTGRDEGFRSN